MSERKDYLGILMRAFMKSPQMPSALRRDIRMIYEERERDKKEEKEQKDVSLAIKIPEFMLEEE